MKFFILLLTIICSSYFSFGQDPSVFTWSQTKVDIATKSTHKVKYIEKKTGKRGTTYLKYIFEPEGNLLGVVYTFQGTKLVYITPIFLSNQAFVDAVQRKIFETKGTTILYQAEFEMVIYNKEKKIYTVLYIDSVQRLLYMCHSVENPMDKILIKKSI